MILFALKLWKYSVFFEQKKLTFNGIVKILKNYQLTSLFMVICTSVSVIGGFFKANANYILFFLIACTYIFKAHSWVFFKTIFMGPLRLKRSLLCHVLYIVVHNDESKCVDLT